MLKDIIKKLREGAGLTQFQLAEKAGISFSTVRIAEQGGSVSNKTKRALATALGVSLAELGGPNVARRVDELTAEEKAKWGIEPESPERKRQRAKEERFGEALKAIYAKLGEKANLEERAILANDEYFHGFQEFLWLIYKYKVEIPKV